MSKSVTVERILACINSHNILPEHAWIIAEGDDITIAEILAGSICDAPIETRVGGLCTYVRVSELCALAKKRFGEDIANLTISALARKVGESLGTDILINSDRVSAIMNERALA